MITCNNVYIGAITNRFYHMSLKEGIEFHFDYQLLSEITMPSDELCSLFYNLVSNAHEAAVRSTKNREVLIQIKSKYNSLIITIINGVEDNFSIDNIKNKITVKKDNTNHGIGLHQIEKIVNSYSGNYLYELKEEKLHSKILLVGVVVDNE